MQVKSKGKFIRISPIKARMVVKDLRGQNAEKTLASLLMMTQKGGKIVAKVLKSAMADAEHNYLLDKKDLTIESITVDKGPSFNRWRPAARGSMKPIEKKTSHITVTVSGEKKIEKIKVAKTHPTSPEASDVAKAKSDKLEDKEGIKESAKETVEKVEEKKFYEDKKETKRPEDRGFQRFFRRKTG